MSARIKDSVMINTSLVLNGEDSFVGQRVSRVSLKLS
jgi:hypothetical protein